MGLSSRHALPDCLQLLPFWQASNQRWSSGECWLTMSLHNWGFQMQKLLIDLTGRRIRFDSQITLQGGRAGMIDAYRAGAIIIEGKQVHQATVEVLTQRIVADQTLSILAGSLCLALLFKETEQVFEGLHM